MTTLFRQLPEMNWFAATHFCHKTLSVNTSIVIKTNDNDWLTARNISNDESIRILEKFFARK